RAHRGGVVQDRAVGHGGPDLDVDRERGRASDPQRNRAGGGHDLQRGGAVRGGARRLEGRAGRQGVARRQAAEVGRGAVVRHGERVVKAGRVARDRGGRGGLGDREVVSFLDRAAGPVLYTLSLHDALPISRAHRGGVVQDRAVGHGGPDLDVDRER